MTGWAKRGGSTWSTGAAWDRCGRDSLGLLGLLLSEPLLAAALGLHLLLVTATARSLRGCEKPPWMALWGLPVLVVGRVAVGKTVVFVRTPTKRGAAVVLAALVAALATPSGCAVTHQIDTAMDRWCG